MLDALKAPENNAISQERAEIQQAWESKIKENLLSASASLEKNLLKSMSMTSKQW